MRTSIVEWDSNGQWSAELNSDRSEIPTGAYTVTASDGTNTATVEVEIVVNVITPTPASTSTSTLTSTPTATREPTATTAAPLTEDERNRGDGRTAEGETGNDSNLTLPVAGASLAAGVGGLWYWLRDGSGDAPDRTDGDELPSTRKTDDSDDRSELSTGTSDVNANSTTFETDEVDLAAGDTLQDGDSSAGREHPDQQETTERKPNHEIPKHIQRAPDVTVDYDMLTDEEPIGGGGNADVTKATLPTSQGGVTLAIKKPRMQGTVHIETVERVLEEAETWDKLDDHDHIVGVVDYGAEPVPWIAMEYMDAGDLTKRAGELGFEQALWTAVSITRGVRHAHRRGVAHLDLKPSNVLFRSVEGAWDVPKIADWGLSKHLLEHSKSMEGLSPQYAAPEQFDTNRGAADDVTDVYQLGVVIYELFTGEPPFEGTAAEAMHRVLHDEPTPPSEVADVPPALDEVLLTALAKDKTDRYDGVLLLRDALQRLSSDE
jgi:serine/threonine protein kinase